MRRTIGRVALTIVFAALAILNWAQIALTALGHSGEPWPLTAFKTVIGVIATAAAYGTWVTARWAAATALAYGVATAAMIVALGPLLHLPAQARGGLWSGAAVVLVYGLWSAWYLRRVARFAGTQSPARGGEYL